MSLTATIAETATITRRAHPAVEQAAAEIGFATHAVLDLLGHLDAGDLTQAVASAAAGRDAFDEMLPQLPLLAATAATDPELIAQLQRDTRRHLADAISRVLAAHPGLPTPQ
ncbi:hypothetical protein [Nocardia asiatica]|uniref:hypothetical protein n=1 Tax=Nocardia asiatica TaxID=209252 RepID=UPI0003129A58|nr:hypothetical protein [Nocardia asiatica]